MISLLDRHFALLLGFERVRAGIAQVQKTG